jgi:hypothetical protein
VRVGGEATPRRIPGYAPTAPLLGVGQVEPRLGTTITRANVWLVQAPGHIYRAMRVGCHSAGSNNRYIRKREGALWQLRRGADQGEPRLEAGVALAERGARRATLMMDFWGRLHGFAQLGGPKRGWESVGRYHPILRVTETGLRCAGPSFEA